jgi:hypothetical protein
MDTRIRAIAARFNRSIFTDIKYEHVRAKMVDDQPLARAAIQFVDGNDEDDAIDLYDDDATRLKATMEVLIGLPDDLRYLLTRVAELESMLVK